MASEGQKGVTDAIPEFGVLSNTRSVDKRRPTLDMSCLRGPKSPRERLDPVVAGNEGLRRACVCLAYWPERPGRDCTELGTLGWAGPAIFHTQAKPCP